MSEPLISLNNIHLVHGHKTILQDITLNVDDNEIITVIGPNGAGKSSLVKLVTGLISPTQGQIQRRNSLTLGYVPQKLLMDTSIPIKVSRFLSLAKTKKHLSRDALSQVGAEHLWDTSMHTLSGGELQRVLLARAISRKPNLLILDEPLQGVDVNGQIELYGLIADIRQHLQCSVFMVSHDLHLVMAQTDRVLCLNQHICCAGQPESVTQHPEYLRLFGKKSAENIAIYTHHHNHHHDLKGDVLPCSEHCDHD